MKIIADEQIPWLEDFFGNYGELIQKPALQISRQDVKDADLLLVRSVKKINRELLENSSVKMVASPTAGFDHVDLEWLKSCSIAFAYTPGCNANAVAEYVVCCVAKIFEADLLSQRKAAVIGVGHVGSRVVEKLRILGFEVLQNDPPRAEKEPNFSQASLSDIQKADLICIHTPLITSGKYPTLHLIDHNFLNATKENVILLNAGRGEVIDESALLEKKSIQTCLDVWTNEPFINEALLNQAKFATPHIAGYSLQAKYQATRQIFEAAKQFFSWKENSFCPNFPMQKISGNSWKEIVLQVLDPEKLRMQNGLFLENRKDYIFRNEFSFYEIISQTLEEKDWEILKKLGFTSHILD